MASTMVTPLKEFYQRVRVMPEIQGVQYLTPQMEVQRTQLINFGMEWCMRRFGRPQYPYPRWFRRRSSFWFRSAGDAALFKLSLPLD